MCVALPRDVSDKRQMAARVYTKRRQCGVCACSTVLPDAIRKLNGPKPAQWPLAEWRICCKRADATTTGTQQAELGGHLLSTLLG